jgi:hypothetical protein
MFPLNTMSCATTYFLSMRRREKSDQKMFITIPHKIFESSHFSKILDLSPRNFRSHIKKEQFNHAYFQSKGSFVRMMDDLRKDSLSMESRKKVPSRHKKCLRDEHTHRLNGASDQKHA